jgi:hypothetical protein
VALASREVADTAPADVDAPKVAPRDPETGKRRHRHDHADRRLDRSRLPTDDAIADAWLLATADVERCVFCEPGTGPRDTPTPRIVGHGKDGRTRIAVIPGAHLRWLFTRKRGYSRALQYLQGLHRLLSMSGDPRLIAWDLAEPLPDVLLDRAAGDLGLTVERVGPERKREVLATIDAYVRAGGEAHGSWLLEGWAVVRTFDAEPADD